MVYNILRIAVYPILLAASVFKPALRKFIKKRIFQELRFDSGKDYIWVHCASVGEVNLSEPVVRKILEKTGYNVLLTMMTDTGMETAKKKYSNIKGIEILYFPLDDFFAIRRILNHVSLRELVMVETEIWPNLIRQCSKQAPVVVINGRISDKSIDSYRKFRWYLKKLFENISYFIMQSELDEQRIISLGADSSRVKNFGNLKFDIKLPDYSNEELLDLKEKLSIGRRKIFVAGSTRGGEEEKILEVFDELEDYFLILVPRHIERCPDIEERLLARRAYVKWSDLDSKASLQNSILLVNKIGVLRKLYAMCDVAFVGGTLVDVGGHSLLEPLYYGKAPIFGKHLQNVRDIAKEVENRGIGFKVENTNEFLKIIDKIQLYGQKNDKIEKFFMENSSCVDNTFQLLVDII